VEAKKAAPPAALKQVATAAAKAPMKVSPPSARRPKRAVGSIYQRDEPMEESESKKAKKRTKCAMKQVLPAPLSPANKPFSSNKRPTKPNKAVRKSRKKCSFPQNLHALITEAASVAPAVVSWFERGEAFIVHDPESAKLGELLQKHFNHSNFGSLQRQLNMYGFSKSRKAGKYQGAFHHEFFHRDRPEDLDQITRSGPPNLPSKRQAPKRTIQQMKINQNQVENKSDESKVKKRKAKLQRRAKHLPANKRLSNRNAENQVPSKPIGLKEKFKAMAATRPTLVWRT
jgi:hypothetical protein